MKFLLLFQSYGVVQGAAMAIVFNWDMLSFIPMTGLSIGVMSLIGRFVGAGNMARANQVADGIVLIAGGALRGAGDTRWIMITSISVHWLMLVAQYFVIVVFEYGPLVSWWVFVAMLISLAFLYLWRLFGSTWREPARLARVMSED